jgi:hypothetical protein
MQVLNNRIADLEAPNVQINKQLGKIHSNAAQNTQPSTEFINQQNGSPQPL